MILIDGEVAVLPDFVIPRLGSSSDYFTLAVIRQLELLGVYLANSAQGIATVKDKFQMHQLLAAQGLPTPKTMLLRFPIDREIVRQEIGFPMVVKNVTGTEGNGVYLCTSEEQFTDLMELIHANNSTPQIILQKFIQTSYGQDLRIFVVGGKVIGHMKRFSTSGFKANFSRGGKVAAIKLTAQMERLALQAAQVAGLEISGIDLLFDQAGRYQICEANSSPGFKGLEQVMGLCIAEQIIDYIVVQVRRKGPEKTLRPQLSLKKLENRNVLPLHNSGTN
jgi:RimK family alpha-L-glutamate ligase